MKYPIVFHWLFFPSRNALVFEKIIKPELDRLKSLHDL